MGNFIGHVLPGAGFFLIGLWHLFNTLKNYARSPEEFHTRPWFPAKFRGRILKHLELLAILAGSCLSISAELFIGPKRHQPLADDWTIPPDHLNNFEHSSISLFFLIYAAVAIYVDNHEIHVPHGLLHVIAALAFSQELLLFHLHSADHMGAEGQYHWLLQLIVLVSLTSTILEVPFPKSFLVAMVRSMSILFQGLWFVHMGFMLWIPAFIPKGCKMNPENGHMVVKCDEQGANMRAKALANLQFNWYLASLTIFTVIVYVKMMKHYGGENLVAYRAVESSRDVEMGNAAKYSGAGHRRSPDGSQSSMDMDMDSMEPLNLER
ncbi:hypothetical protein SUGI_0450560 [Cryptomeria japonica]|uniref:uncharacterized protein LOC131077939 n=1 Tax=Cryptomeria japonica TaxID=3369 RepID=UPI002408F023|nr:uncharacterized protein LOC131077939 [Cryptomeria japonica]GLJ23755.1 hypothetical protein SUGI_0450560 [Cryptomeria japonica]